MSDIQFQVPDFANSFATGVQTGRKLRQQAQTQNALAMAPTNPVAAQNALLMAGALPEAQAVGQIAAAQQARASRAKIGQLYQAGDTQGATAEALGSGETATLDAMSKLSTEQRESGKHKAIVIGGLSDILSAVPMEQRQALWDKAVPALQQQNILPPNAPAPDLSDESLKATAALGRAMLGKAEDDTAVVDHALVNKRTGQPIYTAPPETTYMAVPQGGKLVPVNKGGAVGAAAGGAPNALLGAGAAPQGAPMGAASPAASGVPRGIRNNNPLNVTNLPNGAWNGQTGSDGKFAQFATPQDGWNAAHQNLIAKQTRHGLTTLNQIIGDPQYGWAPASDNNDPKAYAATVAKAIGVSPDAPLDLTRADVRERVLSAMANVENGSSAGAGLRGGAARDGLNAQGDPVGTIYGSPKPVTTKSFRAATPQELAAQNLPANAAAQVNPETGQVSVLKAGGLTPQENSYLEKMRASAQDMQSGAADAARFVELNKKVPTGGAGGMIANLPVLSNMADIDPSVAEMRAITSRLTPAMRQGLPGAASDRDVAMFRSATVDLGKPGPANQAIAGVVQAAAKRQADYAAFLDDYARRKGTLSGAQEQWSAYANANPLYGTNGQNTVPRPTTPWRQWFASGGSVSPPSASPPRPGQGTPSATGVRQPPRNSPAIARPAPPAAVQELRGDPSPQARAEFDQVFGAGASARALGGR